MKFKNIFSIVFIALAVIFTSCGNKELSREEMAKRIIGSEEPAVVMSVNLKDILDKGGISSKENIPMMAQMLFSDKVDMVAKPEKAGLDVSGKSFVGMSSAKEGMVIWGITGIKDKEAFEKMLKEEGNEKFEEIEGYNTSSEDKESIFGWNEKVMIYVVSQDGKAKDKFTAFVKSFNEDEKKINENYAKFFSSNADVAMISSVKGLSELQQNLPTELLGGASQQQMEMSKAATKKMEGCYSLFETRFENDKITADFTNMLTPEAKKQLDFFGEKGLPDGMLSLVGSDEILAFASINGNLKKYMDYVKSIMGENDVFAELSKEAGMDINEFINAFKGNVFVAFAGFEKKEISLGMYEGKEEKYTITLPKIAVVASTQGDFLMNFADSILKNSKKDNYFVVGDSYNQAYLMFTNEYVKYANNESLITAANANPKLDAESKQALEKPLGFYVNLNKLIGQSDESEKVKNIASKFKYAFGGMDLNGGHAELHLNNGGKNGLWTLINIGVESTAEMAPSF